MESTVKCASGCKNNKKNFLFTESEKKIGCAIKSIFITNYGWLEYHNPSY